MRFRKYYDALRTNKSFLRANFSQKSKILNNIIQFFISANKKSLILNNKPVVAQIEPTSKCNLKCGMCVREKIGVPIGTMSFSDFKKILDKLDSLFKIHLSGQGEPFLNPDLLKMIEYANKKGITVHLTTNGTILTEKIIDGISKVDVGEIAVSIDSPRKETYERIRKGAKFEKVITNLKNLISKLKKEKRKTIVSIATVILKENINDIPEFIKLADKIGIEKVVFQTIQEKEDYMNKYGSKTKIQAVSIFNKKLKEKIKEAKKLAKKHNITVIFDEEKSIGCIWPWRSIYITWNGNVTVCCKILDYRNTKIGNILHEDIWDIWNNKSYQKFRRLLRERKAPIPCKGCNMV